MIDHYIARYHIDPSVAAEAMAILAAELARMLVDMNVPRTELTCLAHGLSPAVPPRPWPTSVPSRSPSPTARCARRTPGNQAHVTNAWR